MNGWLITRSLRCIRLKCSRGFMQSNMLMLGDCLTLLPDIEEQQVNLVWTSPPYYNARPEYAEYSSYQDYLCFLRDVFIACHRVLEDGRFLVVNVAPVLLKRTTKHPSKRLPIPFDLHYILDDIGYDFMEDIIWRKPNPCGLQRGAHQFADGRKPLQYKPTLITEYILVYRKRTNHFLSWNIGKYTDSDVLAESRIGDDYEKTNVWDVAPARHRIHPAIFPEELVTKVVQYYSFSGDVVLDPFAGIGTTGKVCAKLGRRFILMEKNLNYYAVMEKELSGFMLGNLLV